VNQNARKDPAMEREPIIVPGVSGRAAGEGGMQAVGQTLVVGEWAGSGPGYLHVHHEDDEAWHVLEGTLHFRFTDREVQAPAGTTVFVPAGVPHSYEASGEARYLIILTPRLLRLIEELHETPIAQHGEVMRRYRSEIVTLGERVRERA
jgi:mannose-6-phosphate isomerase-like protein (cupin superfamily)